MYEAARPVPREDELAQAYRHCRAITCEHSKTFSFAAQFLSGEQRRGVWAAYAFCRTADDIVDGPEPVDVRLARIDGWRSALLDAYDGRADHPVMRAYADTAQRFAIPAAPALELLAGARADVTWQRCRTFAELHRYCYLVAGTVGLITAPILGHGPKALSYAVELGRAMQLTNILRDVGEDARLGRIYLPLDEIERFGYDEERLVAGVVDEAFVSLMQFQIARARAMYAAARPGIDLLAPGSRYTVRVAWALYRGILARIEANDYDVFTRRAHVPTPSKLAVAFAAALAP